MTDIREDQSDTLNVFYKILIIFNIIMAGLLFFLWLPIGSHIDNLDMLTTSQLDQTYHEENLLAFMCGFWFVVNLLGIFLLKILKSRKNR